jgi:hypothetical protein
MNYQEKAEKYLKFFEYKKRGEDTIVILKDNAPAELQESVHNAHGDRLPSDWIYDKYESILSSISDYDSKELDDIRAEIVDGLVDVYTSNLTEWLNDDNRNVYYLSEALAEYGDGDDGFALLAQAQYRAIDEIFGEVAGLLEKEAENE